MRRAALVAAALLASCAPTACDAPVAASDEPAPCRTGPDGGLPGSVQRADRGIGGTGITSTGIIGVVTGFASICLAGREVTLDDAVPVRVDGAPASAADLRAGQLAAVEAAAGSGTALRARNVAVRHELIGPIEAVAADGTLRVAGQRVVSEQAGLMPGSTTRPRPGEWVAVSGLRGPDDTIRATRLDGRAPGTALVRGTLRDEGGTFRLGALEVRLGPGRRAAVGRSVTVLGRYEGGVLFAAAVTEDVLAKDPATYFGAAVRSFVLERYVSANDGRVQFSDGLEAAAGAGIGPFESRRSIVELERGPDGLLRATALNDASGSLGEMRGSSASLSRPGRDVSPPGGPGGPGSGRGGGYGGPGGGHGGGLGSPGGELSGGPGGGPSR